MGSTVEENTSPSSLEMKLTSQTHYSIYPSEWLVFLKHDANSRYAPLLRRLLYTKPLVFLMFGLILGGHARKVFGQLQQHRRTLSFIASPTSAMSIHTPNLTVGVYYYPWYAEDFHYHKGFVREQLHPPQGPALGKYNDSDPAVIEQHLAWSKYANIRLWVMSWWGEGSITDETIMSTILPHKMLGDHKLALFYETNGRMEHGGRKGPSYSTEKIAADMQHICKNYFTHPNYYKVDGKPVLFVYLTRDLSHAGLLDQVIGLFRETAKKEGFPSLYIIGDQVFGSAPKRGPKMSRDSESTWKAFVHAMEVLDGVTNYDVYGSMGRPSPYATTRMLQDHFRESSEWRDLAHKFGCAFVPSVAPGYNDLGVRYLQEHAPLSRRIDGPSSPPGSLFRASLRYAGRLVEQSSTLSSELGDARVATSTSSSRLKSAPPLLLVNSFNEWHEDSQIEPVIAVGGTKTTSMTAFSSTSLPYRLTRGLDYEAYGTLYLDILREETASMSGQHINSHDHRSRNPLHRHISGLSQFGQQRPRLRSSAYQAIH